MLQFGTEHEAIHAAPTCQPTLSFATLYAARTGSNGPCRGAEYEHGEFGFRQNEGWREYFEELSVVRPCSANTSSERSIR